MRTLRQSGAKRSVMAVRRIDKTATNCDGRLVGVNDGTIESGEVNDGPSKFSRITLFHNLWSKTDIINLP